MRNSKNYGEIHRDLKRIAEGFEDNFKGFLRGFQMDLPRMSERFEEDVRRI